MREKYIQKISVNFVLYLLAKKYLVRPLIRHCESFLLGNLCAKNVFTVLQYTIDCESDKKLTEKCSKIICAKTKDVLKSDGFLKISHKCLMFLLDQNSLSASETELFNAVTLIHQFYEKMRKSLKVILNSLVHKLQTSWIYFFI